MFELPVEDRSILHDVNLVFGNDVLLNYALRDACWESVMDDAAATNNVQEAYMKAHLHRDETWVAFVDAARVYVIDVITELLYVYVTHEALRGLFIDLLDLNNRSLWCSITEDYMPDPDEVFPD